MLEDAQWADQATIEVIAHVVATLAHEAVFRQLPLMLLVTTPPNAAPNPRRLLARLAQETIGRSLHLEGLDELGIFALASTLNGLQPLPSPGLLRFVRDSTGGNPLEIESLVARLDHAGALEARNGEVVTAIDEASALSLDTDAELAAKLQVVSEPARQLLLTHALLRDGRLMVLHVSRRALIPTCSSTLLTRRSHAALLVDEEVRVGFAEGRVERANHAQLRAAPERHARRDSAPSDRRRFHTAHRRHRNHQPISAAPDRGATPPYSRGIYTRRRR